MTNNNETEVMFLVKKSIVVLRCAIRVEKDRSYVGFGTGNKKYVGFNFYVEKWLPKNQQITKCLSIKHMQVINVFLRQILRTTIPFHNFTPKS